MSRRIVASHPIHERFCGKCKYLSLTEEEQNEIKNKARSGRIKASLIPNHYCRKYNTKLVHGKYHPQLMRLIYCISNERKEA